MQFRDLSMQYQKLKPQIDAAVTKVMEESDFISGVWVKELEKRLASYVGVKHCITCANGTDALTLALMAWNITEGDAVFVPDFTFFASGETVSYEGATPIFVDVDADTFNMSSASLEKAVIKVLEEGQLKPRAIVAVDLFGQPADYEGICRIADQYNLHLLEDAAQGFGGTINGKRNCSFGEISTTSFFPAKPLGCYGDGGAIFTDNDDWADLIRSLCVHGKGTNKYDNVRIGMNSRLDTIQAGILMVKMDAFESYELKAVNEAAKQYTEQLKDIVKTPLILDGYLSSYAQYTIQLKNKEQRDSLQNYLKSKGIPSMIYYPKPMHRQKAFADSLYQAAECPVSEFLCDRVLSLPMHPYLSSEDILKICQEVKYQITKDA